MVIRGESHAFELSRSLFVKDADQCTVRSPHVNLRDEFREDVSGLGLRIPISHFVIPSDKQLMQPDDGDAVYAMNMS